MKMNVHWIVFYGLTIWLITIMLCVKGNNLEVIKEVSIVISNLISGWLGYLVRQLGD